MGQYRNTRPPTLATKTPIKNPRKPPKRNNKQQKRRQHHNEQEERAGTYNEQSTDIDQQIRTQTKSQLCEQNSITQQGAHAQRQKQLAEEEQYNLGATIIFRDPLEQRWQEANRQEINKREANNPLNREPYTHPNDTKLIIYPERRDRTPWTEQYELDRFGPTPETEPQKKREEYAMRDLA